MVAGGGRKISGCPGRNRRSDAVFAGELAFDSAHIIRSEGAVEEFDFGDVAGEEVGLCRVAADGQGGGLCNLVMPLIAVPSGVPSTKSSSSPLLRVRLNATTCGMPSLNPELL